MVMIATPNTVGVPTEKSKDFAGSSKRLFRRLGPERPKAYMVLALAVASVALVVSGPKILGHATNLIFEGLVRQSRGGTGIDFAALHTTLWFAVGLYLLGYLLAYLQAFVLAGVVQRTMYRLRAESTIRFGRRSGSSASTRSITSRIGSSVGRSSWTRTFLSSRLTRSWIASSARAPPAVARARSCLRRTRPPSGSMQSNASWWARLSQAWGVCCSQVSMQPP